jgi:putative MATE family efflux protein
MKIKNKLTSLKSKYVGDRSFYRLVLGISVPMMIQNGITNLVSMLDNIMVGRLGTESMSGVSIVNQFVFIFNLLVFGSIAAASIFTSQYYGTGDEEGLRHTFRFKLLLTLIASVIGTVVIAVFHNGLVSIFLHESDSVGDLALTLSEANRYLFVMLIGLIPYAVAQVYASNLRETGEVVVPMLSSVIAVGTNFILNLVLIFGLLGAPALGVVGAAIATVFSRFVELFILVIYAHRHTGRFSYLVGVYRSFRIPKGLLKAITVKAIPLMMNEFLFALAITLRNQCYSTRGLDVVAGQNIASTVFNLCSVIYMSLGASVAIIIGSLLGAERIEEAKDKDRKLIAFSVFTGFIIAAVMVIFSFFFPHIYNTTESVRHIASFMMIVQGLTMPFLAFSNAAYFTLRSGGKVLITILFDSLYMWAVVMPTSFIVAYLTDLNINLMFIICQGVDMLKCIFGAILLKHGGWEKVLVNDEKLKD